jgi:hypothetical protein
VHCILPKERPGAPRERFFSLKSTGKPSFSKWICRLFPDLI